MMARVISLLSYLKKKYLKTNILRWSPLEAQTDNQSVRKEDLCDSDQCMVVVDRWTALSNSETADIEVQPTVGFTVNGPKKKKKTSDS